LRSAITDRASGKLEFDNGLPSKAFFDALYQCLVQGIFADPIYVGNKNKAGWKLIGFPGVVATRAFRLQTLNA
jgi:gluconate 2-dehydrogenase gamma chain